MPWAWVPRCCPMQEFIHQMNIAHYRKLLASDLGEAERKTILELLAQEEAAWKALLSPDEPLYKAR